MVADAIQQDRDQKRYAAEENRWAAQRRSQAEFVRQRAFSVEVASMPPGAIIEVDEDTRGTAPCVITIDGQADRTVRSMVIVKAIPNAVGEWVQTKFIMTGQKIPTRMFFNMNLSRAQPEINVHVN